MGRGRIRLTESALRRMIKESVKRALNEIGDTRRGQYMLGRAFRNSADKGDFHVMHDIEDRRNDKYDDAFNQGYDDQYNNDWRNISDTYRAYKIGDMDELGEKFISFIEHYHGGTLMQTVVDYESGNQTGKKESPLGELIPYFEEEVLGQECTPDMVKAITNAYNQWWYFAEDSLL